MIETLIDSLPDQICEHKERKLSQLAQSISDDFHDANTIDTNQFCGENEQFEVGKNYEFLNLISVDYFEDFDEVVQKQRLEKFKKKQKRRNRLKGKHEKQEKRANNNNSNNDGLDNQNSQNSSFSQQKINQKNSENSHNNNNNIKNYKKSKNKSPSLQRSFQSEQQFTHDLIEIIHQNTEFNKNNKQKQSEKMCEIYRETLTELQNEKIENTTNINNEIEKQEEIKKQIDDHNNNGFKQVEKKKYYLTKIDKNNWHKFHKNNQKQQYQQQQTQYTRNRDCEQKTNYREFDEIAYNRKQWKEIKRQKDYQFDKYYKQSKNPKYFQKKKVIDYEAQYYKNTQEITQPIIINPKSYSRQQNSLKQCNENSQQYMISKKKKDQSAQVCLDLQSLENLTDYKQIIPNFYRTIDDFNKRNKDSLQRNRKSQTSSLKYEKYQNEIKKQLLSELFQEKVIVNECDIFNCQNLTKELSQSENYFEKSLSQNLKFFIKQFPNDFEKKQNQLIKLIFQQHLSDFFSVIDQLNSKLFVIRKIIFLRLQYEQVQLNLILYQLKIDSGVTLTQYGSTTTSLNLPASDLDLLIQGLGLVTKFQTQQFLSNLFQILQNFKWIVEAKAIFTANVPILKLKIDPFIDFTQTRNFHQNFILHPFATYSNFNIRNKTSFPGTILNVDISMETINENNQIPTAVGIQSTKLIQKWLDTYPHLQQLALILKSVLSKNNLNQTFYGGMSSYSLLILIIAFLQHKKIESKQKLFQVLKQFCYFYAFTFQSEKQGIRIDEEDKINSDFIFNLSSKVESNKIIIYEPITKQPYFSQNIEINKIFSLFGEIYKKIEELENQVRDYFNEKTVTLEQFLNVSEAISLYRDSAEINLEAIKLDELEENFLKNFTDYEEQKKKLNR